MKSTIIPRSVNSVSTETANSTEPVSFVPRLANRVKTISKIWSYLGIIVLLLMVLIVTTDVVGRYIFNSPLAGSTDILEIMMIIIAYSSFAYCQAEDKNVRIKILYDRFPKKVKASLDIFTAILSITIVGLITWRLGARALNIVGNPPGPTTTFFQWELLPFIIFAAVGCGILVLQLFVWLIQAISVFGQRENE